MIVFLCEGDRVTGPVQAGPLGSGVADMDPFQKVIMQLYSGKMK
jgi:hypothetical protein